MVRARFLEVPCRFPQLQKDRNLRAAIRFALEKQLRSLESQRLAGTFVLQLIGMCQHLLDQRPQGLPWTMSMEEFFEAWVETLASEISRQIGGIVWTGRERQTVLPLLCSTFYWRPRHFN
jgi:hypothetical protein